MICSKNVRRLTVIVVAAALTGTAQAESQFEFFARSLTVRHQQGVGQFVARLRVTPAIRNEGTTLGIDLNVLRIEMVRVDPPGLGRVSWEFDLSDCDMRKMFEVEVELDGANGRRTEPVDQNGNFAHRDGDVVAAVNVKYEWLGNAADWQFTHGREVVDGVPVPQILAADGGARRRSPRVFAEELRKQARQLRERVDRETAEIDVKLKETYARVEPVRAEHQEQLDALNAAQDAGDDAEVSRVVGELKEYYAAINEIASQAAALKAQRDATGRMLQQADDLEHDAEHALAELPKE